MLKNTDNLKSMGLAYRKFAMLMKDSLKENCEEDQSSKAEVAQQHQDVETKTEESAENQIEEK